MNRPAGSPDAVRPVRRRAFRVLTVVVSVIVTLCALELLIRAGYYFQHPLRPPQSILDRQLGWVSAPGLEISYDKKGYGPVNYSTDAHGFRRAGDTGAEKVRLFAIGDSTTQAIQVSDGKTYFDHLADNDERLEVFAYGVGGYGPLQHRLALERHIDRIDPQIVLWQLCANDLINSDFVLESRSNRSNNHMTRPFLEDGRIVFRHPDGWLGSLAVLSYVFRRLAVLRGSIAKRTVGSIENELEPEHPDLERALATMKTVISGAIREEPDRVFVALNAFGNDPREFERYVFDELCEIPELHCVTGIEQRLDEARAAGLVVDGGFDAHWNERGHAIAGQTILDYLQTRGLIDASLPSFDRGLEAGQEVGDSTLATAPIFR